MKKPKSLTEVRLKDAETYLFLEHHHRQRGEDKIADDYKRLAQELLPREKRKRKSPVFSSGRSLAPIYTWIPSEGTFIRGELEGIAELVKKLETQSPEGFETWSVIFPGRSEGPVFRWLPVVTVSEDFFSTEEKKARRKARRLARKANKAPREVLSPEEKKAKKLERRQNKQQYLNRLLWLKPKGRKKPQVWNYEKFVGRLSLNEKQKEGKMESLELLNDQYGHCGECHEVHYIPDMVVVDGYYYCKSCSRPTPRALDTCPRCEGVGSYCDYIGVRQCGLCGGTGKCQ